MAQQTATTALQLYTGDEQERLRLLAEYKPHDHLVSWVANDRGKSRTVNYYPAAWRLYELSLRYPFANFSSEIVHKDPEKNFVVVRVRLYLGPSYEDSPKKAEAHKQGPLSELDKVETKAKARAARDFGIGTEHALDMDDVEADAIADAPPVAGNGRKVVEADAAQPKAYPGTEHLTNGDGSPAFKAKMPQAPTMTEIWDLFVKLYKPERWPTFKQMVLERKVEDKDLTDDDRVKLWDKLVAIKKAAATSGK